MPCSGDVDERKSDRNDRNKEDADGTISDRNFFPVRAAAYLLTVISVDIGTRSTRSTITAFKFVDVCHAVSIDEIYRQG